MLDDFRAQVLRDTDHADYPLASDVRDNVLVYSAATVSDVDRRTLQSELIRALSDGPGVVVFEGAYSPDVVDRASDAFFAMIAEQPHWVISAHFAVQSPCLLYPPKADTTAE